MTNLTRIPVQDNYSTTLTAKLTASATDLTIYVKAAPSYTPTSTATRAVINPGKTNMEVVNISAYDSSAKTFTIPASGRAQTLKEGVTATVQEHASGSTIMISDNFAFWEDIQDAIATKADIAGQVFTGQVSFSGTTHGGIKANSLTTAQRDALVAPGDGLIIYNTTSGEFQIRQGSAWSAMASGSTQPDASTTVAGKVEMATDAETIAGTTTGGTGAQLSVNPGNMLSATVSKQTSAGVGDAGKFVSANAGAGVVDSTFMPYTSTVTEVNRLTGISANVTATNLNTLTAGSGSDADALHTHASFGALSITAGEAINGTSTPQACFVSPGTTASDATILQSQLVRDQTTTAAGVNYRAQTFTTGTFQTQLTRVDTLSVQGAVTAQVDIYAVDGSSKPTGVSLGSQTNTTDTVGNVQWLGFTFASPITVTPNTQYAIVLKNLASTMTWHRQTGDPYTSGQSWESADAGGTWTSPGTQDNGFRAWGYEAQTAGRLYRSDKDEPFRGLVDGFVTSNTAAAAAATFRPSGFVSGFTGLTAGATYYVDSTIGAITTSTGGLKIGKAMSTTAIGVDFTGGYVTIPIVTSTLPAISATNVNTFYFKLGCGFKFSRAVMVISVHSSSGGNPSNWKEASTTCTMEGGLYGNFAGLQVTGGGSAYLGEVITGATGISAGIAALTPITITNNGAHILHTNSSATYQAETTVTAICYR